MGENQQAKKENSSLRQIGSEAEVMISEIEAKGAHYFQPSRPLPRPANSPDHAASKAVTTPPGQHRRGTNRSKLLASLCLASFLGIAWIAGLSEPQQQQIVDRLWSARKQPIQPEQFWRFASGETTRIIQQFWPYQSVGIAGIKLPITNRLCNRKGNFCIHRLANLMASERGEARYSLQQSVNGQVVEIHGTIEMMPLIAGQPTRKASRQQRFRFRDDQAKTTLGWAALGTFAVSQANDRPGIETVFRTTQSLGPHSPVGAINREIVFPTD